jgi:hypothetical protein
MNFAQAKEHERAAEHSRLHAQAQDRSRGFDRGRR